jgi:hypothetical protein
MTWSPSSSSISKARFVTAGAISMKLGVIRPELFLTIWPILWPILKIRLAMVVGKLTKCLWAVYLIRLHHILPGFWIWPTFQGHRGHQVAILKKQLSAVTPELMPGSSPNFNHWYIRIHNIIPGFLIWPTFQGHSGQSSMLLLVGTSCCYWWPRIEYSSLVWAFI